MAFDLVKTAFRKFEHASCKGARKSHRPRPTGLSKSPRDMRSPGCSRKGVLSLSRQRFRHAAEGCGWLFIDESPNQGRRWCDMKVCRNRAKARRQQNRELEERLRQYELMEEVMDAGRFRP